MMLFMHFHYFFLTYYQDQMGRALPFRSPDSHYLLQLFGDTQFVSSIIINNQSLLVL